MMTSQQITAIKQLNADRRAAGMPDLQEQAAWANDASRSGTQTGTTPANVVNVHDLWTKQRILNAKAVLAGTGITRAEITNCDAASVASKITTWINGHAVAQRPLATVKASAFFGLLFDRLADAALDSNEDATQDLGSKPVYANSWSEINGFGVNGVTRDAIEYAIGL